jgi:hypothetical protein
VALKLVCEKRYQNRKRCYLAHESYREAAPVKNPGETSYHLALALSPSFTFFNGIRRNSRIGPGPALLVFTFIAGHRSTAA